MFAFVMVMDTSLFSQTLLNAYLWNGFGNNDFIIKLCNVCFWNGFVIDDYKAKMLYVKNTSHNKHSIPVYFPPLSSRPTNKHIESEVNSPSKMC